MKMGRQQRRQRKEGHLFREKLIALPPPDLTNQNQLSLDLTTPPNPSPKYNHLNLPTLTNAALGELRTITVITNQCYDTRQYEYDDDNDMMMMNKN